MKTSKQIQQTIDDGVAKIEAILSVAKEEDRETTPEEQTAIDAFHGKGDEDGEFGKLQLQLAQANKIETRQKEIAKSRLAPKLNRQIDDTSGAAAIPATARRNFNLKAFNNTPEGNKDAYVSGQFILAAIHGNRQSAQWLSENGYGDIKAAMSEGTNSAGGFAVPDPLEAGMIKLMLEYGVLRRYARMTTMSSDTHAITLRSSGNTVYYPGENTAITASDLVLARATLTAKKYACLCEVSTELSEDALINVADELASDMAYRFAIAEDTNGFIGDGTGTYASVTGLDSALNANSVHTALAGNISFATLDMADFEGVVAKLKKWSGARPAWFINSAGYHSAMVRLMNASGGTPGTEVAAGYDAMFLGKPVVFTEVLPSAPGISENVCFLGDLSQAVYMGTRRGVTITSDAGGKYFEKDQIAVKGTERVAITVANQDASAAGPVVALATPGA